MSIKNGLRWKTEQVLNDIARLSEKLTVAQAEDGHISCVNCDHWDENSEMCLLAYSRKAANCRPPARIIAFGCPEWLNINDDVPFQEGL